MKFKVTATFLAEEAQGDDRTFLVDTREQAEELVAAGKLADRFMQLIRPGWEVEYTIEEVEDSEVALESGYRVTISYQDGDTLTREFETREFAELGVAACKEADEHFREVKPSWNPTYTIEEIVPTVA